jgi:hypothetical protein
MTKEKVYPLANDFINTGFNVSRREFLEEMRRLHPTLQQIFAGLVLSWITDYGTNYRMDDRNKCSIKECRKLLESFRTVNNDENVRTSFPLV